MLKRTLSALVTALVLTAVTIVTATSAKEVSFYGYNIPIDVEINGCYLASEGKGFLDSDGITYIPVRYASNALGANVTWIDATSQAIVTKGETELVFDPETCGCYINGVWTPAAQKHIDNVLYTNANFLFPALGATATWDSLRYEYKVTLPDYLLPLEFVEPFYTPEDVYWLSKIVTCESGSVSFEARVMVANVVINRRESNLFPNTIKDVIYDKKFGVQFPPAHNGSVDKASPTSKTILACKAALNGLELAPDCLYFTFATSKKGWVATNRTLYKVLGRQAFYK